MIDQQGDQDDCNFNLLYTLYGCLIANQEERIMKVLLNYTQMLHLREGKLYTGMNRQPERVEPTVMEWLQHHLFSTSNTVTAADIRELVTRRNRQRKIENMNE